jgi:TusA-related sulfurtransferase
MTDKCHSVLNLSGVRCPYSLLELNRTFKDMKKGATAEITADRVSIVDEIERWYAGTGNEVVSVCTGEGPDSGTVRMILRKASPDVDLNDGK